MSWLDLFFTLTGLVVLIIIAFISPQAVGIIIGTAWAVAFFFWSSGKFFDWLD